MSDTVATQLCHYSFLVYYVTLFHRRTLRPKVLSSPPPARYRMFGSYLDLEYVTRPCVLFRLPSL